MHPLVFENDGSINFAPASAVGVEVRFRFEYLPHPNVDPAYDTAVHTIMEGANELQYHLKDLIHLVHSYCMLLLQMLLCH